MLHLGAWHRLLQIQVTNAAEHSTSGFGDFLLAWLRSSAKDLKSGPVTEAGIMTVTGCPKQETPNLLELGLETQN